MLRSVVLAFVLAAAPAVAWAQPARTDQAQAQETAAERRAAQEGAHVAQLKKHYQDELDAIDRLKKQKASWRRDREMRAQLADSADTAKQLERATADLAAAQTALANARTQLVVAIDAEVAAGSPRADKLAKLRAQVAPQVAPPAKRIVIPDAEIDELADPEELEQQAAAIRDIEQQLARQKDQLDHQARDLRQVADLRSQHQRANDMMLRDDDQPNRNPQPAGGGKADTLAGTPTTNPGTNQPTPGQGGGAGGAGGGTTGGDLGDRTPPVTVTPTGAGLEAQLAVTLGDVIDHSTIDGLLRAARSGDPAQRADAAQKARDAVAARLEQLQKKRKLIEQRAKQLQKR